MFADRRDLHASLFLVAVATLLFADVLFFGAGFWARDLFLYHYPLEHVVRETILRGEFPWWNPLIAGGQPMAANPAYEVFYPPQWLIFLGSFRFGFNLHIVAHVYLALLGMYALLRALPLRVEAALFGAISFGLGGLLLGTITNLPTFFVWSWAPLVACCALRDARAPSRRGFTVAAIVLAMPLLVCEPVALAQLWLLLLAGAWMLRAIGRFVLVSIASAALAAVQLLPMIDHLRDSSRALGLDYETMIDYSMPPLRAIELLAPGLARLVPFGTRGPYLLSLYCGIGVTLLFIAGCFMRLRGKGVALALIAISYLLAIGDATPLFRALYAMGLRTFRYPEKFMAMGVVTMIVVASMAVDRTMEVRRVPRGALLAALAFILVDLGFLGSHVAPRMPSEFFTPPPIAAAIGPDAGAVFHRGEWLKGDPNGRLFRAAAPAWTARNGLLAYTPATWDRRGVLEFDIDETQLLPTHRLLDAMQRLGNDGAPRWSEPFALLADAGSVLDFRDYTAAVQESGGDPERLQPVRVQAVPHQGRYWFARHLVALHDVHQLLSIAPGTAYVDGGRMFATGSARVLRASETSNRVSLDVVAEEEALLVVTITRHKYWKALIDRRPQPLVAANIAFQGLVVPPGRHTIELRYWNPLVPAGGAVSACALLILALLSWTPLHSRR